MKRNEEMYIDVILPEGTQDMLGKQLPSIDSILTWKDFAERRLHVDGVIDDSIVSTIGYFIKRYNLEDEGIPVEQRKPIKMFINSPGGDLNATMAVCDLMDMSKTPIWTISESISYSAGGLLLIAGHKKFTYKSSTYLLHAGSTGAMGSTTQVFDTIEFQRAYEEQIKEFVLSHTKFTEEEYDKNYRKELYLNAKGMLKHGVVDEILTEII